MAIVEYFMGKRPQFLFDSGQSTDQSSCIINIKSPDRLPVQLGVNKHSDIACVAQLLKVLGVDGLYVGSFMPQITSGVLAQS